MLKYDRQNYIISQLQLKHSISSTEIINDMDCSLETLRRDLIELEKEGRLIRSHGGAYLPDKFKKGLPIQLRETMLIKEKDKMAELAYELIDDGDVIFLDHSSTCSRLANKLSKSDKSVSIITNSVMSSMIITSSSNPHIKLISTGGIYNESSSSYHGRISLDAISRFHASKAFISPAFISKDFGLTGHSIESVDVREAMMRYADKVILLMDHTKIGGNSDVIIGDLSSIDLLISDKKLDSNMAKHFKNIGIQILV